MHKFLSYIILIALVFCNCQCKKKSGNVVVSGIVYEKNTGKPVKGAAVGVIEKKIEVFGPPGHEVAKTYTDDNGKFELTYEVINIKDYNYQLITRYSPVYYDDESSWVDLNRVKKYSNMKLTLLEPGFVKFRIYNIPAKQSLGINFNSSYETYKGAYNEVVAQGISNTSLGLIILKYDSLGVEKDRKNDQIVLPPWDTLVYDIHY